jgi:hypothetical protein
MNGEIFMCMMLYIASDKVLPTIKWDKSMPGFHVKELKETSQELIDVKKQVTKSYIYYAGAHTGCGCGFYYDMNDTLIDIKENIAGKHSIEQLFEYIKANFKSGEELELCSCWAGDEDIPYEKKDTIYLGSFSLDECFSFEENQITVVKV